MAQRVNAGQLMVMVGAAVLLVSLFLSWYDPNISAWDVFEIADIVLAGLAIVALVNALPMRLPGEVGETTARFDRQLPWIGIAALALVIVTLINAPPDASGLDLAFGAWLGLIGALLMTAGGFLTNSEISIVVSSRPIRERDATTATVPVEEEETGTLPDEPPPPPPPGR